MQTKFLPTAELDRCAAQGPGQRPRVGCGVNPTKEAVFAARCAVGHSQKAAAALIARSERSWSDWETGLRPFPPTLFALYLHLTGQAQIPFQPH